MIGVFGDTGRHARSAVGIAGLPGNRPVEVELIAGVERGKAVNQVPWRLPAAVARAMYRFSEESA